MINHVDHPAKYCRYCGKYKPAHGFVPVRHAGKLIGYKCPECVARTEAAHEQIRQH